MCKGLLTCFIVILGLQVAAAQNRPLTIRFLPLWNTDEVSLGQWNRCINGDSVKIDQLRFYVGNIELLAQSNVVWKDTVRYRLLDLQNAMSMNFNVNVPQNIHYNSLRFSLGVDSATNAEGVHGDALDPMMGMYWAWQSGYINLKLEGKSSAIEDAKHEFQFHLGGFLPPDGAMQWVEMPLNSAGAITCAIQLDRFFNDLDWSRGSHIMSPGNEAVRLSKRFASTIQSMQR